MENLTLEEEFGVLNLNEIASEEAESNTYYHFDAWNIFYKIVEIMVIILSLTSCVTVIYVIRRFDYLQTRRNSFIFHYYISFIIFFIFSPIFETVLELASFKFISGTVICVLFTADNSSILPVLFHSTFLAFDWLFTVLNVSWMQKYEVFQKYFIFTPYIFALAQFAAITVSCFTDKRIFYTDMNILEYFVLVVIVIIINIVSYFKRNVESCKKHRCWLNISSLMLLSWLPELAVYFMMELFFRNYYNLFLALVYTMHLVALSVPLIISFWLDTADPDFNKAYRTLLRNTKLFRQEEEFEEMINADIANA